MRLPVMLSVLLAASSLQAGCVATTSDLSGSWSGSYVDGRTNLSGPLAASFSEQSGSLSGTLTISSGWICSVSNEGSVSGTVSGDQVQASATFGLIATLSFTGKVSGNTLNGTYQVTGGICSGDSGSFTLSR